MENTFQLVRCVVRITTRTAPNRIKKKTRDNFMQKTCRRREQTATEKT